MKLTVTDDDGRPTRTSRPSRSAPRHRRRPISFVGQATRNVNSTAFTVQVPAGVQPGDALLLFASQGSTTALTGPGAGWTQIGRVVDGQVTTVWRKVATAADAGSTVRWAVARRTSRSRSRWPPIGAPTRPTRWRRSRGRPSPGAPPPTRRRSGQRHRPVPGGCRTGRTRTATRPPGRAPAGEQTRATTVGSGGGRVSSLLTDSGAAMTAGTPASTGGLLASANAGSSTATMWTILLRPGE